MTTLTISHPRPLEIWGGVECTIARVEDRVEDQLVRSGHDLREDDLERFAALGLRTLRFPILWERHTGVPIDWVHTDRRMETLRRLGIRPIVGLIHHGGGPLPRGLADPGFVEGLARFAAEVAIRYPWVDAYTPVNEPLTTARFSGMYGVWFPHGRSTQEFARLFLNECQATRAAMTRIRAVNPAAQLIQTEDVGKTHSTPHLAYQADLENERRWLTFDILRGELTSDMPMWRYLTDHGISPDELRSFNDAPCAPDLLGMNYYVTSERFIDERLDRYPPHRHGGNQREAYADVTAVRVRAEGILGHAGILRELWARYRKPIALTEVQLACTREEQLRWFRDARQACLDVRDEGADIRALTAWALLGAYDWDSLLVERNGHYENGAFDVRGPAPRPTALASAIQRFTTGDTVAHPAAFGEGWWRRDIRLEYDPVSSPPAMEVREHAARTESITPKPLLIVGAHGSLGSAFRKLCALRGLSTITLDGDELDVRDAQAVSRVIEKLQPWAVINASDGPSIDDAERDPRACFDSQVEVPVNLARACATVGSALAIFSSDQVFDGSSKAPYSESSVARPLNAYGRSQYEAESRVGRLCPHALIVRAGPCFGPWDDNNFVASLLNRLDAGEDSRAADDLIVSPTYIPDLVNVTLDLLIDGERGVWHLANQGATTWADWAVRVAQLAGHDTARIHRAPSRALHFIAPRPRNSALTSERGVLLGPWKKSLERYFNERSVPAATACSVA